MPESDLLATRATVILDKPEHWTKWLFLRKSRADRNDLWKYVDPSLSDEEVSKLETERPVERQLKDFHKPAASSGDIADSQLEAAATREVDILDLTDQELRRYEFWYKTFCREEARWLQKEKALKEFNDEISSTIASRHIHLIADCSSAYDRLRTLKKHLCPSQGERNAQLRARYRALQDRPRKANLDSWFEEWLETARLMSQAKMPEVEGNRAQEDFILAIKGLDDNWSTNQLTALIKKEEDGEDFTSISVLVAQYASYYRRTRPIASGLGTFATLGVASPEVANQPTTNQPKTPTCVCGQKHRFDACSYVNKSLRASDWRPDPEVEKKFQELRTMQTPIAKILQRVEEKLAKSNTESKATGGVTDFDDGQKSTAAPQCGALLQVAAVNRQTPKLPLLNTWILDPGSNAHVTNTKSYGWKTIEKAEQGENAYAGNEVYAEREALRDAVTLLDIAEPRELEDLEIDQLLASAQGNSQITARGQEDEEGAEEQLLDELRQQTAKAVEPESQKEHGLLTPEETPEPGDASSDSPEGEQDGQSDGPEEDTVEDTVEDAVEDTALDLPRGWQPLAEGEEVPDRHSNNAPRRDEISSKINLSYIVDDSRRRRMPEKMLSELSMLRLHRDQLPPPPERWKDRRKHDNFVRQLGLTDITHKLRGPLWTTTS